MSDGERPLSTEVDGPLMARWSKAGGTTDLSLSGVATTHDMRRLAWSEGSWRALAVGAGRRGCRQISAGHPMASRPEPQGAQRPRIGSGAAATA